MSEHTGGYGEAPVAMGFEGEDKAHGGAANTPPLWSFRSAIAKRAVEAERASKT